MSGALLGLLGGAPMVAVAQLNVAVDSDGDGLADRIDCGDFDADGVLETADVQACYDALEDDPDGVHVHVAVAGAYASPSSGGVVAFPAGNTVGAIELGSRSRLSCAPGVSLEGWSPSLADPVNKLGGPKVIYVNGADDVEIRDCQVDGMMPTLPTDCQTQALGCSSKGRFGVHIENTTNFSLENLHVVNTQHACIYVARGRDGEVRDNLLENCGGYYLQNMESYYPGIYLYSRQGTSTARLEITGNTVRKHAAAAYTMRNNDGQAGRIVDVLWEYNHAEDGNSCFLLRGARRHTVRANTCVRTDGIVVHHKATQFCSVDDNHECVQDIEIVDNVVMDVVKNHAFYLYDYSEGVTLEGNYAEGTPYGESCLLIEQPNIGLTLLDNHFSQCGGAGMEVEGSTADPAHAMTWQNIEIESTGAALPAYAFNEHYSGVRITGDVRDLQVDGLEIRGTVSHGIDVTPDATLTNTHWSDLYIDGLESGFMGGFLETAAPTCDAAAEGAWIETMSASSASDCAFQASQPYKYNRCRCIRTGVAGVLDAADVPMPQGLRLDPSPAWLPQAIRGGSVWVRDGSPDGEACVIDSHSEDEVACVEPWTLVPAAGDDYVVYDWEEVDNQSHQRWGVAVRSESRSSGNSFEQVTLKNFLNQHAFVWSNTSHDANHFADVLAVFDAPQQGLANERPMDGAIRLSQWMTGTTTGPIACVDTDPTELCFDTRGADVTFVPEPAPVAGLLSGLALLRWLARRRRASEPPAKAIS